MAENTPPPSSQEKPGARGAAPYTKLTLLIYDFFVLKLMSYFVWRCSTSTITLPFFRAHVRRIHLDVGVGTGYFLRHGGLEPAARITLCDLNANCLAKTKARLAACEAEDVSCLEHDILEPLPAEVGPFESISLMYLLHCLPPPQEQKCQVLRMLKGHLEPGGVLFGCAILGLQSGVQTRLSRLALRRINAKGRMGNLHDTEEFVEVLRQNYVDVESRVVGSMLLFSARKAAL